MSEMEEFYREAILDKSKSQKRRGALAEPCRKAKGINPLCGDEVMVWIKEENGILSAGYEAKGCAVSQASAAFMAEMLHGREKNEGARLLEAGLKMFRGEESGTELGKAQALGGISQYPMRVKCASLSWQAAKKALSAQDGSGAEETDGSDE